MDFTSLFDEIEFTQLQDHHFEKYTTYAQQELLLVVPRIMIVNGYQCKVDGCVYYYTSKKTIANHCLANHFLLPFNGGCKPRQVQHLFKKVGYTAYFGVDHQNMELIGDQVGLQLKQQVHVSLEAHQCSTLNMAENPTICELNPWLIMFHWHKLLVNHIIPTYMPLDHIEHVSMFPTLISGEFNLDNLPLMV
jgi:hypothetical protein